VINLIDMDKDPKYFEGTLQLRNPSPEVIEFVASAIEKEENVWVAKTNKEKKGIDLDLSSNKFLRKIGKMLKEKFTGELVESKSIFTRNRLTGKEVYRGCVLFKYYDIKKGDEIKLRGETYQIISIGTDIFAKNIETNEKKHIKFSQLEN
jgi:NMD protein affecting ribosome stability and mRNA decay